MTALSVAQGWLAERDFEGASQKLTERSRFRSRGALKPEKKRLAMQIFESCSHFLPNAVKTKLFVTIRLAGFADVNAEKTGSPRIYTLEM